MHELAICQALVGELQAVAAREGAGAISDVYVSIGPLSGVEPALLSRAFGLAAAGSVAADAGLHLTTTEARVACTVCGEETEVPANRLLCGRCGSWRTRLVAGDELLLERVELTRTTAKREEAVRHV